MEAVNVSGLKNNPSEALRMARRDVVVVMNRDKPDALMVGIESSGVLEAPGVRPALATALFRDGHLSLVRAAHLAADGRGEVGSFVLGDRYAMLTGAQAWAAFLFASYLIGHLVFMLGSWLNELYDWLRARTLN